MKFILRNYQNENNYWRIRSFLRETFLLNDLREFNWHVACLDYWRWHVLMNCREIDSLDGLVYIWETDDGQIAAVLNSEGAGDACLQVHPDYCSTSLENEMITFAENKLAIDRDGQQVLSVWANHDDPLRTDILKQRGYTKGKWTESQWRRDLDMPIPEVSIPDGYTIRSLGALMKFRLAVGLHGVVFTRMSQMKITRAGNGISTSNAAHSIVEISTSSLSHQLVKSLRFARCGMTILPVAPILSRWPQFLNTCAADWRAPASPKVCGA